MMFERGILLPAKFEVKRRLDCDASLEVSMSMELSGYRLDFDGLKKMKEEGDMDEDALEYLDAVEKWLHSNHIKNVPAFWMFQAVGLMEEILRDSGFVIVCSRLNVYAR